MPATSPGGTEKPGPLSSRPAWRRGPENAMDCLPPRLAGTPMAVAQPESAGLDAWLVPYNAERPRLGYRNMGRRPAETVMSFDSQEG